MSGPPSDAAAFLFAWAYAWQLAFDLGRADERERIGEAVRELDACWAALDELDVCRYRAPRTWEQQVAERVALFEHHADGPGWTGTAGMTPQQRRAAYRDLLATWDPPAERRAA